MASEMQRIAKRIAAAGGQAFLVGGAVRDSFFGKKSKDLDIEVFGLDAETLTGILQEFGRVSQVGTSFGVIKLTTKTDDFDFSLPRRESKAGKGHKGFVVEFDPSITPREAARRRDFTFNAMSQDILTGKVIDFFGGQQDIENRIARATSRFFGDDPLRVLRGMQFSGRFGLKVEQETAKMCRSLKSEFHTLPVERIWIEWQKWAAKSVKPSMGLRFLVDTGWIEFFPEIARLQGVEQDKVWHPEGDVFEHTCMVVDSLAGQGAVLVFAGLCHDMGKVETTEHKAGRIISHGHAAAGAEIARTFMARIGAPKDITEKVVALVKEHMVREVTKRSVLRLAHRLAPATIEMLAKVMQADSVAKSVGQSVHSEMLAMARAQQVQESAPKPIIMGRHLIDMGMTPGREFGKILSRAFQAQIDGVFDSVESGIEFVETIV